MSLGKYDRVTDMSNPLGIPAHDFIQNTYDVSGNLTVVEYKLGGQMGTVVAVLTMTYDGSGNLLTVTRT
jgi:hypothetical protein